MRLLAWMAGGVVVAFVLGALTSGPELVRKFNAGGEDQSFPVGILAGYVVFGVLLGILGKIVLRRMKGR